MRPVSLTKSLTSASANCIAQAQSLSAAGNVVLNGGSCAAHPYGTFHATGTYWTLDTPRRVAIVSAANDASITATIRGFRGGKIGQPISEVLALTNGGTAVSVLDYGIGGNITLSGSTAGNVTIGTNGTGSTDWIMPNFHMAPFEINILDQVTGSVTWNLETTNDGYAATPMGPFATTPQPNVNAIITASTVAQQAQLISPVVGYRFTITAGQGTLAVQSDQAGIVNY